MKTWADVRPGDMLSWGVYGSDWLSSTWLVLGTLRVNEDSVDVIVLLLWSSYPINLNIDTIVSRAFDSRLVHDGWVLERQHDK